MADSPLKTCRYHSLFQCLDASHEGSALLKDYEKVRATQLANKCYCVMMLGTLGGGMLRVDLLSVDLRTSLLGGPLRFDSWQSTLLSDLIMLNESLTSSRILTLRVSNMNKH